MKRASKKKVASSRPSWDDYFMELARVIGTRSTCDRGMVGSVIVRGKQLLTTGYAGSPSGMEHCDDAGHLMKKVTHEDGTETMHCVRTVHAEQNAIVQAAKLGVPLAGATLYCKMTPCRTCAMLVISAGIIRVVAEKKYHVSGESERLFRAAGVTLLYLSNETAQYR